MTDTPWTPGPWRWIGETDSPGWHAAQGLDPGVLFVTHDGDISVSSADARLIAAAPDLAEFVRSIAEGPHHPMCGEAPWLDDGPCGCLVASARTLLSRIRGETETPA